MALFHKSKQNINNTSKDLKKEKIPTLYIINKKKRGLREQQSSLN